MKEKIYLVVAELVDGRTPDGEYFVGLGAYRDKAAAESRAEAERVSGNWGHFDIDADCSDAGWHLSVEPIDLIG